MAKDVRGDFSEYLTENATVRIGTSGHQQINVPNFGERAVLHVFRTASDAPPWMKKLKTRVPELVLFERRSGAAVLIAEVGANVVVLTFAHGWMLLDEKKFVADFGLLVAVNALDSSKLKRLERSNLGDAMQGVAQSPFQRDFRSFGIDDALDLVRKLSGETSQGSSLDTLTGARSLKITGEYVLDDLPPLIPEIVNLYQSKDYQNTPFSVLDFVRPVVDRVLRENLLQKTVESIKGGEDRFELGLPSTTEAEGVSFSFVGPGLRRRYPDLLLRHYTEAMGAKLANISTETLSDHKIVSQFDDDRPSMSWTLLKSIVGSISLNQERYAINDGQWYRIDDTFRQSVEQEFANCVKDWDTAQPDPIRKHYDKNKNGKLEREKRSTTRG
ncbi:TIGR04141 family sporadically distributed protein [Rhodophyticola porphyridii]|uniref:TIGR04141 family sporadically distributed protein n=1 Tax=Rhodophyticola porphyridii TaxID=1852017 RepID=UPI001314E75D|nr:TIGR04141 family sporadically distributed protein [Rhodophyticola porphyridii]